MVVDVNERVCEVRGRVADKHIGTTVFTIQREGTQFFGYALTMMVLRDWIHSCDLMTRY